MQVKKIHIFLILCFLNYYFLTSMEVGSKLENNIFITRTIFRVSDYSICIINGFDNKNSELILDFSYKNNFLKAGRIKRLAVWRELFSPLAVAANSDLFKQSEGFDNNYLFNKGGLYGASLKLDKELGISFLFPDNLWMGANYTKALGMFSITSFISGTAYTKKTMEEWTSDYPIIPNTNPIHLGLRSVLKLPNFTFDYLGTLSGSSIFKAGFYTRVFFEVFGNNISFKGYGGIISPCFISTDLRLPETKYLINLYLWKRLSKKWDLILKTNYQEDQKPVLPFAYIPTSGTFSVKLSFDNSQFIFSTDLGQKFNFDFYGNEYIENIIKGKIGLSGRVSSFFYYDYTFDFDKLVKRKFEVQFKAGIKSTDIEFVFKHGEDIFESLDQKTMRIRIDQKIAKGDIFFKIELGNKLKLEKLSIGFSSVFSSKD